MATPTEQRKFTVRRQAFNFDTFAKDKLAKVIMAPAPVSSLQEALQRANGDEKALLKIINVGLDENVKNEASTSADGWMKADASNNPTSESFTGAIVSPGGVMQTARVLAMTIFGMTPEMSKDEKKAKRQQAMEFIKANDAIREKLKTASLAAAEEDDTDED